MGELTAKPLTAHTWPDFERLVQAHNGVWGGCWCMAFHPARDDSRRTPEANREDKLARVERGEAHASLVYDGSDCVGWCQFGPAAELPRIKRRRAYDAAAGPIPDWRITCFFVGKTHRKRGVAAAALAGALAEIECLGGGSVESYPEDVGDRKVAGSFLYNATVELFEQHGFERSRRLGKNHWVVTKAVPGAGAAPARCSSSGAGP